MGFEIIQYLVEMCVGGVDVANLDVKKIKSLTVIWNAFEIRFYVGKYSTQHVYDGFRIFIENFHSSVWVIVCKSKQNLKS